MKWGWLRPVAVLGRGLLRILGVKGGTVASKGVEVIETAADTKDAVDESKRPTARIVSGSMDGPSVTVRMEEKDHDRGNETH